MNTPDRLALRQKNRQLGGKLSCLLAVMAMLLLSSPLCCQVQIQQGATKGMRAGEEVEILGEAKYRVYYQYLYKPEPESEQPKEGLTLLLIGNDQTRFLDFYSYRSDSIAIDADSRGIPSGQVFGLMLGLIPQKTFEEMLIADLQKQALMVQGSVAQIKYQYYEPTPPLE